MGNTHIWILLQQDGLREKERARSGGETERTEQEEVYLIGYQTAQGGEPMGMCSPTNAFLAPLLGAGC